MTPNPTPAAPSLAVVVCAYTRLRFGQVVEAVAEAVRQCAAGDEVVLVVDNNRDLELELAASVQESVLVVPNVGARGLSGARNTGAGASTADVVVFLDDDALLRPGALDALRDRVCDPSVAVVGGAVHAAWEGGRAPSWFPEEFGWVVGCDYRGLPADGQPIRNPIGACMAVRRDALVAAGGFSAELGRVGTLPAGCEETLMGIAVRRELPQARLLRDTGFAVDHHVPSSRQTLRYFTSRCYHEGRSKAVLVRVAGAGAGLSSERSYVVRTLATAVLRAAGRGARGDAAGAVRGLTALLGLGTTVVGVLSASLGQRRATPRATSEHSSGVASGGSVQASPPAPVPLGLDALVTVVVPTVGRHPRMVECVEAVLAQSHSHLELLVVDNAPETGEARSRLGHLTDARLHVVPQHVRGASAARNAGIAAARGEVVLFTDDDAIADPDWVADVLAAFAADPAQRIGCITGRVLGAAAESRAQEWFEESEVFDKGVRSALWSTGPVDDLLHLAPAARPSSFFPYTAGEMGSGNNMAFRTAVVRSVGGFDEALGPGLPSRGGEDLDLLRRVVLAGHVVLYRASAVVRHHHRTSTEDLKAQMFGYGSGMGAVLTKLVLSGPRSAAAVLARVPRGLHTLLAPRSVRNAKRPSDMPRSLLVVELSGYLAGPWLYLRSTAVRARPAPDLGGARGRS